MFFLQDSHKNRHPERSASHNPSRQQRFGAKSKDPEDEYLVDAVWSFSTTEARLY
jgi:hypothetical protein